MERLANSKLFVWFGRHGHLHVHQGHGSCVCHASRPGHPDTWESGRLASPCFLQVGGHMGMGRCPASLSPAWHCGQPSQVLLQPLSNHHLSGDDNREPLWLLSPLKRDFNPSVTARWILILQEAKCCCLEEPAQSPVITVPVFARGWPPYAVISAGAPKPVGFRERVRRDLLDSLNESDILWWLDISHHLQVVSLEVLHPACSSGPAPRITGGAPIMTTFSFWVTGQSRNASSR